MSQPDPRGSAAHVPPMATGANETPDDYTWRVTNKDGAVTVEMGTSTQGTPLTVIYLGMGRALIKLGQQFLENVGSAHDDDE